MKKIFAKVFCFLLITYGATAQRCPGAHNSITPLAQSGIAGFSPSYDALPCINT